MKLEEHNDYRDHICNGGNETGTPAANRNKLADLLEKIKYQASGIF